MQTGMSSESIKLQGPLTVEHASGLKSEIAQALSDQEAVLLDFSRIEDLDLACLQVLYAARLQAQTSGKGLHFVGSLPSHVSSRLLSCGILSANSAQAEDLESALASF